MAAARDELEARTADGVTLRIDRVRAVGERRGVIVCLHAMMTDGRYLDRFAPYFGENGFKRMIREGRLFQKARYAHNTTSTGPGHAVIGSGRDAGAACGQLAIAKQPRVISSDGV